MAVALSANALCSLDEAKEWLQITEADKDEFLKRQINRATGLIEHHTKRKLKSRLYVNDSAEVNIDGAINGLIYVWQYPMTAVAQVLIDGTAIEAGNYDWDVAGWVRLSLDPTPRENSQWTGSHVVRVDFTAGYDETLHPEEWAVLNLACVEQTGHLYWRAPQGKEARAGIDSRSQADVSESFSDDKILPISITEMLSAFVRNTWVPHRVRI